MRTILPFRRPVVLPVPRRRGSSVARLRYNRGMILHLTPLDDWLAAPDRPYTPDSLANEGYLHCAPDERTALAVANARFGEVHGPLMVLLIDEDALDAPVRWEAADGVPPPGAAEDVLFPHVHGPVNRGAVAGMLEVRRGPDGRWASLVAWS